MGRNLNIRRQNGDVISTFLYRLFSPNDMAGTSEAPVSNATRTNPRRFATTHRYVFRGTKPASLIPPTTKPTAVDVHPSELRLLSASFGHFKRVFNEFSDAELTPQPKRNSRCNGISVLAVSVVNLVRMPGNNDDHFE